MRQQSFVKMTTWGRTFDGQQVNKPLPLSTVRQSEVSEVPPLLPSRSLIDVCEPFSQSKSGGGGGDGDWQLFPLPLFEILPHKSQTRSDNSTRWLCLVSKIEGSNAELALHFRSMKAKCKGLYYVDSACPPCRHNVSLKTSSFGIRTMDKYFGGGEADEDLLVSAIRFTRLLQLLSLS